MQPFASERQEAFEILLSAGWIDRKIATAFGVGTHVVYMWRKKAGIAPNGAPEHRIDNQVAFEMHGRGASDGEIARFFSLNQSAVTRWRQKNALARNFEQSRTIAPDISRKARKLLRLGWTSQQVADETGVCRDTILSLRQSMKATGLRQIGISNRTLRLQLPKESAVLNRIRNALGKQLPPHILEDAVSEMYLALLDGKLMLDDIETRASSFRSRAFEMCGSAFGARSLDEEDENGITLLDRLGECPV